MLLKRHTWSNSLHTSGKCAVRSPQNHCKLKLSLRLLCSLGILSADVGTCFWNTEVHVNVYMELFQVK